jgi:hypothetical protein
VSAAVAIAAGAAGAASARVANIGPASKAAATLAARTRFRIILSPYILHRVALIRRGPM